MKKLLSAAVVLAMGAFSASAEEIRKINRLVGEEVLAFNAEFKNPKRTKSVFFAGVTEGRKHETRPFYAVEVGGETFWISESAFEFADRPLSSQLYCNTRSADHLTSSLNSAMGSGEKSDCVVAPES